MNEYYSGFSSENQQDTDNTRGDLLVKLAHMIMKAEKYHKRLFANWICLDSGCVTQSKSKGLRTVVADGVTLSPVQRLGNLEELLVQVLESKACSLMSSGKRRGCPGDRGKTGNCLFFTFKFCLGPLPTE